MPSHLQPRSVESPRSRWQAWGVGPALAVGLGTFLVYGAVSLVLYANYRCGMDLAIFDQAVRNLSQFHAPISSMKSPGMNLFGDHFHPILILAAPSYWIWDDPRMLLLVQALMVGLTAAIVVMAARRIYFRGRLLEPLALGLAFATSYGVGYGAVFDFHEVALGMPILALAMTALLAEKPSWLVAACSLLFLVKEDTGIIVFGIGMVAAIRGLRRVGAGLMAGSVAWTLLVLKVIIPALSPTGAWLYASSVGGLGAMVKSAGWAFVTDGGLSAVFFWLILAFLGLPLRSNIVLVLLPNFATRAVSPNVNYWTIHNHYNLLPAVVVAFAAMEALATKARHSQLIAKLLLLTAGLALAFGPVPSQWYHTVHDSRAAAANKILGYLPAGAPVAADAYLTPHLTKTHPITQQVRPATPAGWPAYRDDLGRPLVADYLIFDTKSTANMSKGEWTRPAIEYFRRSGFQTTHTVGDFVMMERVPGK